MKSLLEEYPFILSEGALVERLRRNPAINLHPSLVHAPLIYDEKGRAALTRIYQDYLDIAREAAVPFLMCTPTWRTNRSRVNGSGFPSSINPDAAQFMTGIRNAQPDSPAPILIGGMMGCKHDCYRPDEGLSAAEAKDFHSWQIDQLAQGGVDFLLAETLPAVEEATGIAQAMESTSLPYLISFVINRQGCVLDGTPLSEAIEAIDLATSRNPIGYMANCAYPTFLCAEQQPPTLFSRLVGFQANASALDHGQLDNAEQLESEPVPDWGDRMRELNRTYGMQILGGCCGTDARHLRYLVAP